MAHILITGANGFVGGHLVPALLQEGHGVTAVVRRAGAQADFGPCGGNCRVVPVGSIDGNTDWGAALDGIDAVVHCAARVHVMRESAADPLPLYRAVNRDGTRRLAEAAASAGVRRFLYLSSIKAVTDEGSPTVLTEALQPVPGTPYGVSKLEAEAALFAIAAATGLEAVVLRPPLIYGAGVRGNFLALLRLVQLGLPLPLAGIANRRSLLYVGNLVAVVRHLLADPDPAGHIFFAQDGPPVSTPALIRAMARALERPCRLFPLPSPLAAGLAAVAGGVWSRLAGSLVVDDSPLRARGFRPPFSLDQGLAATAAWFRAARP